MAMQPSTSGNSCSSNQPKEYPRGRWHTQEQVEAFREGLITASEYVFLGLIDALCNWKKQGCWASDDYLAEQMHLEPRQVRNLISHLSNHNLIQKGRVTRKAVDFVRVGYRKSDGMRILVTKWFLFECGGSLPGVDFNHSVTDCQTSTSALATDCQEFGNRLPNPLGNGLPHSNTRVRCEEKELEGGAPAVGGTPPPQVTNGFGIDGKHSSPKKEKTLPEFCEEYGNEVLNILRTNSTGRAIDGGTKNSRAEHIYDLWRLLGKNLEAQKLIKQRIDDYRIHFKKILKPDISSVKQFCSPTLFNWIGDEVKKLSDIGPALKAAAKEVEEESRFRVTANGEIQRRPAGSSYWVDVPEDQEDTFSIWPATADYAAYLREKNKKKTQTL